MKRYISGFFLCFVCSIFMFACGNHSAGMLDDNYHADTDFQFFQSTNASYPGVGGVQETKNGCVFYHDEFIYTYDQKSGNIMPLCSRINCLHDKETDPDKRMACNAYMDHIAYEAGFDYVYLMLYKEQLYIAYKRTDVTFEMPSLWTLYRLALDGTSKDEVYRCPIIEAPLIHRGYMYYFTQTFEVKTIDGRETTDISSEIECHRLELESQKFKDEILSLPTSGDVTSINWPRAFGKQFYFSVMENNSIIRPMIYDIVTGTFEEIDLISSYTFCRNCLYSTDYGYPYNVREEGEIYVSDYRKKEVRKVLDHVSLDSYIVSDQKYIYVNNALDHWKNPDIEIRYQVYDPEMTLVDEFTLPETMKNTPYSLDPPIGGEKYQYLVFNDHESGDWGLYVWDKNSIGSLHGKPYEQTKIVYGGESIPAGSQDDEPSENGREEITDEYEAELSEWTENEVESNRADGLGIINVTDMNASITFDLKEETRKEIYLRAWYIQNNTVRVRRLIVKESSATGSNSFSLSLPEGAERFIGAAADWTIYFQKSETTDAGKKEWEDMMNSRSYIGRIRKK